MLLASIRFMSFVIRGNEDKDVSRLSFLLFPVLIKGMGPRCTSASQWPSSYMSVKLSSTSFMGVCL